MGCGASGGQCFGGGRAVARCARFGRIVQREWGKERGERSRGKADGIRGIVTFFRNGESGSAEGQNGVAFRVALADGPE